MLDDHRDLIAYSRQRRGERRERHIPVLTRPRRVGGITIIARGRRRRSGCGRRGRAHAHAHPGDAHLHPDCDVHFFVEFAIGEARRRAHRRRATTPCLQLRGVLFEALADRVELGRVERFWDLLGHGLRRRGGGSGGGGSIEYVGPARARVLLLEVQREQAVSVCAVCIPRPEAGRGCDAAPQARGGVAWGVAVLDEHGEGLGREEDVDVRFGCARRQRECQRELLRVLCPGVGRRWL